MQNHWETCDCVIGIDRMINEGSGAGWSWEPISKKPTDPQGLSGNSAGPGEPACTCQWEIDRMITEGAVSGY